MRFALEEEQTPNNMKIAYLPMAAQWVQAAHQEIEERIEGQNYKIPTHGRILSDKYQCGAMYHGRAELSEHRWRYWKNYLSDGVRAYWSETESGFAAMMAVVNSMKDINQAGIASTAGASYYTQA